MADFTDAPKILKDFLTYMDTIKGKSKTTTDAYFSDLRTFFRFLMVYNSLIPEPEGFYSSSNQVSINALKNISIKDLDNKYVFEITLDDLYEYMSYLNRARDNNARSRARKVSSLKTFYNYLHNKVKIIEKNPASELDSPKFGKSLPKYLELDDSVALLNAVKGPNSQRDFLIITLFLNCGMRVSELVGINMTDIRTDRLTVTGKGNKQRVIYLNDACLNALYAYMNIRPTENLIDKNALFINRNRGRLGVRSVQNIVKKYLMLAGLDFTQYSPHKLRHTAATLMHKYGDVDIRIIQEVLGHTNLATTEIYTHVDSDRIRGAIEKNPLSDIKMNIKDDDNGKKA